MFTPTQMKQFLIICFISISIISTGYIAVKKFISLEKESLQQHGQIDDESVEPDDTSVYVWSTSTSEAEILVEREAETAFESDTEAVAPQVEEGETVSGSRTVDWLDEANEEDASPREQEAEPTQEQEEARENSNSGSGRQDSGQQTGVDTNQESQDTQPSGTTESEPTSQNGSGQGQNQEPASPPETQEDTTSEQDPTTTDNYPTVDATRPDDNTVVFENPRSGVEGTAQAEPERYAVLSSLNQPYGPHELHKADIYYPADIEEPAPIIVFVHGGGWQVGSRSNHVTKAEFFASLGYVFISVDYRLWPDVSWEQQVTDIARAVKTAKTNASIFNGDSEQMFVMGHSAGGHLAAMVATDERFLQIGGLGLADITGAIILDSGGVDMDGVKKYNPDGWNNLYAPIFGESQDEMNAASPIFHVTSGKSVPPFLLIYSSRREVTTRNAISMRDKVQGIGGYATALGYSKTHEEISHHLGVDSEPMNGHVLGFLRDFSE